MDKSLVKGYRDRWLEVNEVEKIERRTASIALRWQQTNAILSLAIGLGLPLDKLDDQEDLVRQRWAKLKGSA
jgi:hypothetical protein